MAKKPKGTSVDEHEKRLTDYLRGDDIDDKKLTEAWNAGREERQRERKVSGSLIITGAIKFYQPKTGSFTSDKSGYDALKKASVNRGGANLRKQKDQE